PTAASTVPLLPVLRRGVHGGRVAVDPDVIAAFRPVVHPDRSLHRADAAINVEVLLQKRLQQGTPGHQEVDVPHHDVQFAQTLAIGVARLGQQVFGPSDVFRSGGTVLTGGVV